MSYFTSTKDNTKIYFNDLGKGKPVLLIHGWPLCSAMFEYQTQALLEDGHRVISYDRRGFGKSDQPAQGYNYDQFADDLSDLITHLNLSEVRLVGFSMGGGEIARYLSRHGSSKVAKTVLISSVVPYMLKTEDNPKGVPEKAFEDIKSGLKEDRPKFLAHFAKDFYGMGMIKHSVSDEILNWTSALAYQASPIATLKCVDAFANTDFRQDLKSFNIPTLIIHGTADKTVPIDATAEESAKHIVGAKIKRYEGAPHGLFVTHKNALIEDLLQFLS